MKACKNIIKSTIRKAYQMFHFMHGGGTKEGCPAVLWQFFVVSLQDFHNPLLNVP